MTRILPTALAALLLGVVPAMADDAAPLTVEALLQGEIGFIFTTFMFLVAGFLVMWMGCGFAMLEAGLVRSKNVTMQLTKNMGLFAIAAIMYFVVGYLLMYPGDGWSVDGILGAFGSAEMEPVGLEAEGFGGADLTYASVGSDFFFQLMFCAATASIVSGALAERIKLWPFLIFTAVLTGILYPIQASWKWGGGWLANEAEDGFMMQTFGAIFQDFAGSTVVHSVGGWAALAGAIILGPRLGKYAKDGRVQPMLGSNLTLATLGTFILWLGWFGFNGGSQLYMNSAGNVADISRIFANTNTAAAGGALCALIVTQLMYGKSDMTMVLNGALAGLVSITAEPLIPSLGQATLIGAVGGAIVVVTVPMLDKVKIDDVVGAIPVHLFAGIWGTIAVAFTNPGASLGGQLFSIVVVGAFVFSASLILWIVLKGVMGIRVSEDDELAGLDSAELGMAAYPEFGQKGEFA